VTSAMRISALSPALRIRRGSSNSARSSDSEFAEPHPTQDAATSVIRLAGIFAYILTALLPSLCGQERGPTVSPPLYRSDVDLLSVAVRITDRNDNAVHGLAADRFKLYEDGVPQKISFFAEEDEPVSLGILLDVSSSMGSTGKLDHAKEALAQLAGAVRPGDETFYLEFHRQVDRIIDFTERPQPILKAIAKARVQQDGTSLYDAVAKALCYIRSAQHYRRALVVVTDGADQKAIGRSMN
jgi:hypothetical protein